MVPGKTTNKEIKGRNLLIVNILPNLLNMKLKIPQKSNIGEDKKTITNICIPHGSDHGSHGKNDE